MCPICSEVMKNPVQCRNGHCFCRTCLTEWVFEHDDCPSCREKVTSPFILVSPFVKSAIDNLVIACKNADCLFIGTLKDMAEHEPNCMHRTVPCLICCQSNIKGPGAEGVVALYLKDHIFEFHNEDMLATCFTAAIEKRIRDMNMIDASKRVATVRFRTQSLDHVVWFGGVKTKIWFDDSRAKMKPLPEEGKNGLSVINLTVAIYTDGGGRLSFNNCIVASNGRTFARDGTWRKDTAWLSVEQMAPDVQKAVKWYDMVAEWTPHEEKLK